MDRWARVVDHLVGQIIGDGDISGLPGAGKPLPLTDDVHTPIDQRAAFKIMQDNEAAPEWIALAKSVAESEARIRAEIETRARERVAAQAQGDSTASGISGSKQSRYGRQLDDRIEQHNRQALLHNLKAPSGIPHRSILSADKLIEQALAKARRDA